MNAVEFIRHNLNTSMMIIEPLLDDLRDQPLATPNGGGGNHALWTAGHLAFSEGVFLSMISGKPNPLERWKDLFNGGSTPKDDASAYPAYDEVLREFASARQRTLEYLDTLTDADLDAPVECPEQWRDVFGTRGKVFTVMTLHPMHHRGQVADIRRALGRKPIVA